MTRSTDGHARAHVRNSALDAAVDDAGGDDDPAAQRCQHGEHCSLLQVGNGRQVYDAIRAAYDHAVAEARFELDVGASEVAVFDDAGGDSDPSALYEVAVAERGLVHDEVCRAYGHADAEVLLLLCHDVDATLHHPA